MQVFWARNDAVQLLILQTSGRVVVVEAQCYMRAGLCVVERSLSESSLQC